MQAHAPLRVLVCLAAACVACATAAAAPAPGSRQAFAADWQAQGLQPAKSSLDLLYLRPGGEAGAGALQVAPVEVRMRPDWQRAERTLEYARLPAEQVQQLKDEVADIVADELRKAFADAPLAAAGASPVLQARVLDLYVNAPDVKSGVRVRSFTTAFGDMVLVAELRDAPDGKLLLASWDHRAARESATPRLTTRVENATEIRAAAHDWARLLRREMERQGGRG